MVPVDVQFDKDEPVMKLGLVSHPSFLLFLKLSCLLFFHLSSMSSQTILDHKSTTMRGDEIGVTDKGDSAFYMKRRDMKAAAIEIELLQNKGKHIPSQATMAHEIPRKVTLMRMKPAVEDKKQK